MPAPRPAGVEPDATPGPQASLPGLQAWAGADEAGLIAGPRAVFSTNPPGRPPSQLPTLGQVGRYALKYRIGEGGLGQVHAAHDPTLDRLVAIKTISVELPAEERARFNALFLNEARAAAGLSHPNIVTVYDAGVADDGQAYIAMELLKGADLRQLALEGWRPAPQEAARIALAVAEALAAAHARGVVHRDIKPANVYLAGRTQPRVLDFGIARVTHQTGLPAAHEVSAGSPYYMAPEQILQSGVDARSDVYALGVVFYELLADRRAFGGRTLQEIQRAVLEDRPPLASSVAPGVPEDLARIAERAMALDPRARHPSAAALARELQQWLAAQPGPGAPMHGAPLPATRAARRWLVPAAALAAAVFAGAGLWWALRGAAPQTVVAPAPAPNTVAAPALGIVHIEVSPWAEVAVDGVVVGHAPPLSQLSLPVGRHRITLRQGEAGPATTTTVEVAADRPARVAQRLANP